MALYPGFPLAQSDYQVGTISLIANSKNFTLGGAQPLDFAAATAGDEIYVAKAGKVLLIETIANNGGTLLYNCPQDCAGANQPFHLRLKPSASRLQGMVTTLLQKLGSGNLASIDAITLPENHVIAGGQVAGQVKAVNLPAQMNAKLDKAGGIMGGEINNRAGSSFRLSGGDATAPAAILRKDSATFYVLLTNAGDRDDTWNALRPFFINLTTGRVTMHEGVTISSGLSVTGGVALTNGHLAIGAGNFYSSGAVVGSDWQDWHPSGNAKVAIDARITAKINAALANL